jgi:hypothetical protein
MQEATEKMDNLIKYRNDRKSEGATPMELKPIDARITTLLGRAAQLTVEVLPLGPATVKVLDGTDSVMRSAAPYDITIDLATGTVGDLAQKACKVIDIGFMGVKLVNGGKHLDQATPLRSTWIRDGSLVAICNRPDCDGACHAATLAQPAFPQATPTQVDAMRALLRAAAAEPQPRTWACEAKVRAPRSASAVLWEALKASTAASQGVPPVDPWHSSGGFGSANAASSAPAEQSAPVVANTFEDIPEEELYA